MCKGIDIDTTDGTEHTEHTECVKPQTFARSIVYFTGDKKEGTLEAKKHTNGGDQIIF